MSLSDVVTAICLVAGVGLVALGVWLISPPLVAVWLGVVLLTIAIARLRW